MFDTNYPMDEIDWLLATKCLQPPHSFGSKSYNHIAVRHLMWFCIAVDLIQSYIALFALIEGIDRNHFGQTNKIVSTEEATTKVNKSLCITLIALYSSKIVWLFF